MENQILQLFKAHPELALLISLCISVVVAVLGLVPSFFITAANIIFFGFWQGTLVSFLGEAIGALLAFLLYRKGFKKRSAKSLDRFPKVKRLIAAEGKQAFYLIFSLRLFPFVPSGVVTFAAAIGHASLLIFLVASSLGKVPALLIEAYSVYQVTQFGWQGKLILTVVACCLIFFALNRIKQGAEKKDL